MVSILVRYSFRVEGVGKLSFLGVLQKGRKTQGAIHPFPFFQIQKPGKLGHILAMCRVRTGADKIEGHWTQVWPLKPHQGPTEPTTHTGYGQLHTSYPDSPHPKL